MFSSPDEPRAFSIQEQLTPQEAVMITNPFTRDFVLYESSFSKATRISDGLLQWHSLQVTPRCLFAEPPTSVVRTQHSTRASDPRDHVTTRGDPDHGRGGCVLNTPENVTGASLESSSPRAYITASHSSYVV